MRKWADLFSCVLRNAPGADGGAGGGGGGLVGAAGGAAPPGDGTPPPSGETPPAGAGSAPPAAGATPPAAYVPEGLPETLRGGNEKETIDKLWGHFKSSQPPAKPEDYTVTVGKELEGLIDPKSDPVLPIYRNVALKHGLSQKQFDGVLSDLFGEMSKAGVMEKPLDIAGEFAALSDGKGDRNAQVAAGKRVAQELGGAIGALATRGVISKEAAAELSGPMLANANQFKAMRELVAALDKGGGGLQPGGAAGASDGLSDQERALRKMYPTHYPTTTQ